jgi:hypothetical protein
MAVARNKRMTNTTTGGSGEGSAVFAARRLPSCLGSLIPYTHYSLIAGSDALRRYFVEGCSMEAATPPVKDPHRVADLSTLRRWFQELDSSQPPYSFFFAGTTRRLWGKQLRFVATWTATKRDKASIHRSRG